MGRPSSLPRPMFAHVNVEVDGRVEGDEEVGDCDSLLPPNRPLYRSTFLLPGRNVIMIIAFYNFKNLHWKIAGHGRFHRC